MNFLTVAQAAVDHNRSTFTFPETLTLHPADWAALLSQTEVGRYFDCDRMTYMGLKVCQDTKIKVGKVQVA